MSVIPLNPLEQSTNEFCVFERYVIISLPILNKPYLSGNPIVWDTFIVVENALKLEVNLEGTNAVKNNSLL